MLYWWHHCNYVPIGQTDYIITKPPSRTVSLEAFCYIWCKSSVSFFPPDFARAVAARPISYAAVLRMKPDSSSVLSSRSRPRQHHSGGLGSPDWPAFSSHPLSALSLLSSQEDYRSEGKTNVTVKYEFVCSCLNQNGHIFLFCSNLWNFT